MEYLLIKNNKTNIYENSWAFAKAFDFFLIFQESLQKMVTMNLT